MTPNAEKAARLQSYMDAYARQGYFNGAVLVARGDQALLRQGYGWANVAHDVPITPTTRFRIGSVTKQFTAAAILLLQQQGRLQVSDPVSRYLPDYPQGAAITLHQLLTHTAGVPNFTSTPEYWANTMRLPTTVAQTLARFQDVPLDFAPGTDFRYTNGGYLVLTAIVEAVSGLPYGEFLRRDLFGPLGMLDSGYDTGRKVVPRLAEGYFLWEEPIPAEYVDMTIPQGAYGLYATVDDLHRWDRALATDALLSPAARTQMFTPDRGGYAYGWSVDQPTVQGVRYLRAEHRGDINGFCAHVARYPADGLYVAVLSNLNVTPVDGLAEVLARIALGEEIAPPAQVEPMPASAAELERYAGMYAVAGGPELTLSVEGERLYLAMPKRFGAPAKYQVVPVARDAQSVSLAARWLHEQGTLTLDAAGTGAELAWRDVYGQHLNARRR